MIDYSQFKFSATVDWVEWQITLRQPSNAQSIRRHLPKSWRASAFVVPHSNSPNRTASVFTFRVQDPRSAASCSRDLGQLEGRFPFAEPARIVAVEVALDAYLSNGTRDPDALTSMAEHIFQTHAGLVGDWRIAGRKGTTGQVQRPLERSAIRQSLSQGLVIEVGERDADLTQRVYLKTTDKGGSLALTADQHRARIEVTLRGSAMPFHTPHEWEQFDFASLAPFFKFRRLKHSDSPMAKLRHQLHERFARPGIENDSPRYQHLAALRRKLLRRKSGVGTEADAALNSRAYDALRSLTVRQGDRRHRADTSSMPGLRQKFRGQTVAKCLSLHELPGSF